MELAEAIAEVFQVARGPAAEVDPAGARREGDGTEQLLPAVQQPLQQRVLLNCNYLIVPENAGWLGQTVETANRAVFYVVKAAMEYSENPRNPMRRAVGIACNLFRLMNNVRPFVPMLFLLLVGVSFGAAIVRLLR